MNVGKCIPSGIDGPDAQLLLDPQELIVLCHPVTAAGCAALDLACIDSHCQVCNGRVLRFAGTVGDDDAVSGRLGINEKSEKLLSKYEVI